MKCTDEKNKMKNKWIARLLLICSASFLLAGCAMQEEQLEREYPFFTTTAYLTTNAKEDDASISFFSDDLCVAENVEIGAEQPYSQVAEAAAVFNLSTQEVCYNRNMFARLYPASTTKILTAYIILKECENLADIVTISEHAVDQSADSSVCGLSAGDQISVQNLLYGLMLSSGNDAAIALAEYNAGSEEAFAEKMNQTALEMGATGSHFVNPHGLPDDNHYTTVYDMYLILQKAIQLDSFVSILKTPTVTVQFASESGKVIEKNWDTTNRYLTQAVKAPDGITVVGGKTGTTNAAGHCLALYAKNEQGQDVISIVFKADGRSNLYALMNQILSLG